MPHARSSNRSINEEVIIDLVINTPSLALEISHRRDARMVCLSCEKLFEDLPR